MSFGCTLNLVLLTNPPAQSGLVLNEILANNATLAEADGSTPDWIELYNPSDSAVDLQDLSLTDSTIDPRRWVFPPGAVIGPRDYFLVRCDADLPASGANTGFGLKSDGDSVYLYDRPADGSSLLDFVIFGLQTADFSIGRMPGDRATWNLNLPTPGATNLAVALGDPMQLKINEWMADNSPDNDWFEIYNPQAVPVPLGLLYLSDSLVTWNRSQVPALSFIGCFTNAYQRFWADNQTGGDHANFALKAGGEQLGLFTTNGLMIDGVVFGAQTPGVSEGRLPDGAEARVFFTTTPTPGHANYLPLTDVVVSEVLAHSDPPFEDAIELHNLTGAPVEISGWWLSDANDRPQKFRIPPATILPPGGYRVFYEYQFNDRDQADIPFALSSAKGDEVYLSAADPNGILTGYRAVARFGPSFNGVSFGRFVTTVGADFVAMSQRTFGADNPVDLADFRTGSGLPNAYPRVGPVVISEIMYHPPDIGTNDNVVEEFVELHNLTTQTVRLYDTNYPANTWRLRDAVDYDFPPNVSLPAGGRVVVVSFNPSSDLVALAQFQARYGSGATLLGPYGGKLANSDESVELYAPDAPELAPGPDYGLVPYVLVDRVHYRDSNPWPTNADGGGDSLQRLSMTGYGNEPTNWFAAAPNPGLAGGSPDTDGDGMPDAWESDHGFDPGNPADASEDPDNDGRTNLEEYLAGTDPHDPGSVLRIESVSESGSDVLIRFTAVAGKSYTLQYRDQLNLGPWIPLVNVPPVTVTQAITLTDVKPAGVRQRFYRIITPAGP